MYSRLIDWLNRPEYIYQPGKFIRRLFVRDRAKSLEVVELPWNLPLEVDNGDVIGSAISHHGVFEVLVVETIFRLVDRSDVVLDIGANIGYMTAVAIAAGAERVVSIEPNPTLFPILSRNVDRWDKMRQFATRVEALQEAVSYASGHATLSIPKAAFAGNHGLSTLEPKGDKASFDELQISCTTVDSLIGRLRSPVGVLKLDIEGHEHAAFIGAQQSLRNGCIRDIVYESYEGVDSDASRLLADYGYTIFALKKSITGPILVPKSEIDRQRQIDFNLLATREPERLKKRLSPRGYRCLHRSGRTPRKIDLMDHLSEEGLLDQQSIGKEIRTSRSKGGWCS